MANTVRIIPNSGSITFATGVASISSSLVGAPAVKLQITGNTLAINSASVDLATFNPTNLNLDDTSVALIIPSASSQPPGSTLGTMYINAGNNLLEVVGNGNSPVNIVGQKGQKGNTGSQGPIGPKGQKGTQGVQGPIGPTGDQGNKGNKGSNGPQGPTGSPGIVGIQGPPGSQGPTGAKGDKGSKGLKGDIGQKGITGGPGIQGVQGPVGPKVQKG